MGRTPKEEPILSWGWGREGALPPPAPSPEKDRGSIVTMNQRIFHLHLLPAGVTNK
jgi:hypothetical protein